MNYGQRRPLPSNSQCKTPSTTEWVYPTHSQKHSHYAKKRILLRQKPSYGLPLEKLAISPPAHGLRMQNIYHKTKTTVFSFSLPLLKFHSLSTLDQMKQ